MSAAVMATRKTFSWAWAVDKVATHKATAKNASWRVFPVKRDIGVEGFIGSPD
jgi:hypothetical protein